jgi:hypothetical protein
MQYSIKNTIIIEYTSLPENIKNDIASWCGFSNDCLLPFRSEFEPCSSDRGTDSWDTSLTQEQLEEYHKDQIETNNFKGDLENFILRYGLTFEKFLIDQKIDLKGIDKILIDICW